ncbi:MAG: hypothetical protein QUV35_17790 [Hydrogenophaga sp.]|uniref:hypothetical protein n=1 Tax=Hydrogenophaga sp. TaxID=1904254 RepID=UPI002634A8FC|nr:hypothetical protein [Hydrogenophaga sp.]MDM7944478.1 hypothetical protein [Hydrogenophaga sp.]
MVNTPEPLAQHERDAQVIHILNSNLKAQGKTGIEGERKTKAPHDNFELGWLNDDVDFSFCATGRARRAAVGF